MFFGVSLVHSLPAGIEGEETPSRVAGLPPQMTSTHFPLVCPIHRRFPHLSQSRLSQDIPSPLGWQCVEQASQMPRVRSVVYAWQLWIFCFQGAYQSPVRFREWRVAEQLNQKRSARP